jgi:serine/threonine protein kinase
VQHISSITPAESGNGRGAIIIRKPAGTKPAVYLLERARDRVVVKDYGANNALFRNTAGRILVLREKKAYKRLGTMPGIPAFLGTTDRFSLALGFIKGCTLEELERKTRPKEEFFKELEKLIEEVHKKGVAHCDLKRAANIIVGEGGMPFIVDWGTSVSTNECRLFPLSFLYRRMLADDNQAPTKFRLRSSPHLVSQEARNKYLNRGIPELTVRFVRNLIRSILKKIC